MTKLMLVEDDKSLREIYGVRLNAEGYEIISAGDGEEALAMAVKEKPDLILADVMMPKISGFDMLDILRSTPETKDVKVVMMTALSSEDQRARGEALGANRYLVKSQVGIEDVVRTIHDVLADTPIAPTSVPNQAPAGPAASAVPQTLKPTEPKPAVPAPAPTTAPAVPPRPAAPAPVEKPVSPAPQPPKPAAPPVPPAPQPVAPKPPVTPPAAPAPKTTIPVTSPPPTPPAAPVAPAQAPQPAAPKPAQTGLPQPTAPFSTPAPASLGEKVINPISPDIDKKKDIGALIDQELGKTDTTPTPPVPPTA